MQVTWSLLDLGEMTSTLEDDDEDASITDGEDDDEEEEKTSWILGKFGGGRLGLYFATVLTLVV